MTGVDPAKQAAGRAAAELVEAGMVLGFGTGSTVAYFLEALAARGLDVAGIPTSEATAAACRRLGLRLLDPSEVAEVDLAVDGADELTADLVLTKGGGGALLREKVVASMARRMVVVATPDKVVDRLGDTFPIPLEVVPFALAPVRRRLVAEGYEVRDRPGRTDNGNAILDARWPGGLPDPAAAELALLRIPGVAECGLFVGLASGALLGHADGSVTTLGQV